MSRSAYPVMSSVESLYLALRAGPLTRDQIEERIEGGINTAYQLMHLGHVVRLGPVNQDGVYALTKEGRAACPTRREIERINL
jgi:hypothetical protein